MTKYDPILLLVFLSRVVKLHFYVKWLSPFGSSPFLKCIWRITRSTAVASFHGWVLIRTKLLMSGNVYSISLEIVTWSLSKSKCFAYPPSATFLLELALGTHQSHLWTAASQHAFCFTCELCKCKPLCTQRGSVVLSPTSVDSLCHSQDAYFFSFAFFVQCNLLHLQCAAARVCLLLNESQLFSDFSFLRLHVILK